MKRWVISLSIIVLFCSSVHARSIEGVPNEIHDPYFEDIPNNWLITTTNMLDEYDKIANPNPPGGYAIGNLYLSSVMFNIVDIVTIVDDMEGGWNPDYNSKEVDLTFFALFNDPYQFIDVQFGWWNDPNIPEPPLDLATFIEPDGWWAVGTVSQSETTNLTIRNDLVTPEEQSLLDSGYNLYCYHAVWDFQPRWVVVDLMLNNEADGVDGPYVTGIDFEARCVPEPGALLLSAFGMTIWFCRRKAIK